MFQALSVPTSSRINMMVEAALQASQATNILHTHIYIYIFTYDGFRD
jgi:hypothetical protein